METAQQMLGVYVTVFDFYLCNSDAVRIKSMHNVIGEHQVHQRVFINL